jgi:hypothetical protein
MNRNLLPAGPVGDECPHCGVDLTRHRVGLDGPVFVCEVCMHELPAPVPGQRRQSSSTEKSHTAITLPP